MPLPKLSPLQSRLAASLMASAMLLMLYLTVFSSNFAYAAELESPAHGDHNHERLLYDPMLDMADGDWDINVEDARYEADFPGYDRGIIGRAAADTDPSALLNNRAVLTNVPQGTTLSYMFSNDSLWDGAAAVEGLVLPSSMIRAEDEQVEETELDGQLDGDDADGQPRLLRRQEVSQPNRTLWITVNVCLQPDGGEKNSGPAPQMSLYISQSENNTNPGPTADAALQQVQVLDEGWGMIAINATGTVYIGMSAPNSTDFTGPYSASIAASVDQPYHYYNDTTNLHLVDSDAQSALFITSNLTMESPNSTVYQEWMSMAPPYVMFANNQSDTSISGVAKSYCGLKQYAQIPSADGVQTGMTASGLGNKPKQQFYMTELKKSSSYFGVVALPANATSSTGVVGGGGQVWRSVNFTTLSDDNCAVIFNLTFCDQSSYAVPGNTNNFPNASALAAFYDNATQAQYTFFERVLEQIPCETTASAQYSLTNTCADCAASYKSWLCSVMIPRCTDFSSTLSWLQERNMRQAFPNGTQLSAELQSLADTSPSMDASRNPAIDSIVQPGPYKEVLPCDDLCYGIVQTCPSAMGFSCPGPGSRGFNTSYGQRPNGSFEQAGQITCNFPGAAYFLAATGTRGTAPTVMVFAVATLIGMMFA